MDQSAAVNVTAISQLADFISEAPREYDAGVRTSVQMALIDTLGCALAGARQPWVHQMRDTVADWGFGPCTVLGSTLKLSPPWAAMINATASHALEFDDWEIPGNTHPSAVLFPALLSVAAGRPTSGAAVLDAYVVGFEVIARLGEAVNFEHYDQGWHSTATLGAIGASAAVARLMGLEHERIMHALSLAACQSVGYTCQFGSHAKPLQAGLAAKSGVIAASLAAGGVAGQLHVLDGASGFNALMGHGDEVRFAKPFERLGKPLALIEHGLIFKPYPSCGYTHRLVQCALEVRSRPGLKTDEIIKVEASLPDFHAAILPFHTPSNRSEARFSAPFCIALALARGHLTLDDFDGAAWSDPTINRLNAVTTLQVRRPKNPELNYDPADPDWLIVHTRDGSAHHAQCVYPLGAPQNPLPMEQILRKFEANATAQCTNSVHSGLLDELKMWVEVSDVVSIVDRLSNLSMNPSTEEQIYGD